MKWFGVSYKINGKLDCDLVPANSKEEAREKIENKFQGNAEVLEVVSEDDDKTKKMKGFTIRYEDVKETPFEDAIAKISEMNDQWTHYGIWKIERVNQIEMYHIDFYDEEGGKVLFSCYFENDPHKKLAKVEF